MGSNTGMESQQDQGSIASKPSVVPTQQEKQQQQPQTELLEELDEKFNYDGRILRGNVDENRCGYVCIIGTQYGQINFAKCVATRRFVHLYIATANYTACYIGHIVHQQYANLFH